MKNSLVQLFVCLSNLLLGDLTDTDRNLHFQEFCFISTYLSFNSDLCKRQKKVLNYSLLNQVEEKKKGNFNSILCF